MQPLLRIQTVPISIEYKVQRAALQYQASLPKVNISRNRGSLGIQTTPPRLKVDTYETRASAGLKSPARSIQEYASEGRSAAQEATRTFAEDGNTMLDNGGAKSTIADIATSKALRAMETYTAFMPSVRPEVSFEPGSLSFDVTVDKLTFDWNINHKPQLEFVPGSIEFSVAQYNEVIIEYVGSPIYVPPSADPNYELPAGIDAIV